MRSRVHLYVQPDNSECFDRLEPRLLNSLQCPMNHAWSLPKPDISEKALVTEMTHTGEDHSQARFISGGDHVFIPHRSTGLDDTARTCSGGF